MESIIQSFSPIVNEHSKILILGTAPSAMSLRAQQYYANPRNQFWRIVFSVLGIQAIPDNYELKIELLLQHHIALWDVISRCKREGSLDNNIKEEEPNDFKAFFETYPHIGCIAFNGAKSFEIFNKKVQYGRDLIHIKLPSSSPARTIPLESKQKEWNLIKKYLL